MNISGNDIIQTSYHPARQCNKLVHTEHKAIIIVSVTTLQVLFVVKLIQPPQSSNLADQDFRDENRLFC